jgi:hypothetical protein
MTGFVPGDPDGKDGEAMPSSDWTEEMSMDFTAEELREFLEADVLGVEADPQFKEDLRTKLWTQFSTRFGGGKSR